MKECMVNTAAAVTVHDKEMFVYLSSSWTYKEHVQMCIYIVL